MPIARLTSILQRLLLALASIGVALLLLEAILRWVVPYRFVLRQPEFVAQQVHPEDAGVHMAEPLFGAGLRYVHKPWKYGLKREMRARLVSSEFDVSVRTNELGFRGPPLRHDPGYRILGLGDSFAMGYGVEEDETYLAVLAEEMRTELGEVEPVNAGVVGYSPAHSYHILMDLAEALSPDLVVFQLWVGDDLCGGMSAGRPAPAGRGNKDRELRYAVRHSHLAMFVRDRMKAIAPVRRWLLRKRLVTPFPAETLLMPGFAERCARGLDRLQDMLAQAREVCHRLDAQLVVVVIPVQEQVYAGALERALAYNLSSRSPDDLNLVGPSHALAMVERQTGLEILDMLGDLRSRRQDERLYFAHDPHLTAAGHRVIGSALAAHIRRGLRYRIRVRGNQP